MRLEPGEIEAIPRAAQAVFGTEARVLVFGSRTRPQALDDAAGAERGLLDVGGIRHHRDHDVALASDLGGRRRALRAGRDQLRDRRLVQIEHRERLAALDDVQRHRLADRADADETHLRIAAAHLDSSLA